MCALADEYRWYIGIPNEIRRFVPEILPDSNTSNIKMRYIRGNLLHDLFISGVCGLDRWDEILDKIHGFTDAMMEYGIEGDFGGSLDEMYYLKTAKRLEELKNHPIIGRFFTENPIINGYEYPNIPTLLESIHKETAVLRNCSRFTIIHGDLHFGNLLLDDEDNIKAVDPRGRFGQYLLYGDSRYDLAKLYHSIEGGYDYIIEDMFYLDCEGNNINYSIEPSEYGFNLLDRVRGIFGIGDEKDIRLIESLLFLSMIPLHSENIEHQTVMFARGMELYRRAIA